jgi:Amt family ammonium transporter
MIGFI